ncbi:cupin domain-containing protein [Undibacterium arcticum]|uniref:Cupin domain-containing protein n=1 Tax=Undibacterium arcticum TaxID=1762892 RepID=A0ABV7EZ04_9BURK
MSLHHADSGELLHLDPAPAPLSEFSSIALIKTEQLEVIRMTMPTGKKMPEHQVPGAVTLQCLAGSIELSAHGRAIQLGANDLVYLAGGAPHALLALENSTALLTILLHPA